MKTAGAYVVNPWTRELEPSHGGGSCWVSVHPETGEERCIDWHGFYLVPNDGVFSLLHRQSAKRADYARSTWVRIAADNENDAMRAALAAVMFTAEPRRLEEW